MKKHSFEEPQENSDSKSTTSSSRTKTILIIIGISIVLGIIIVPRIWAKFNKKEVTCLNGQTQIYEQYKDAVVLVRHKYALQISIKGSEPFQVNVDHNLLMEQTISGTGFFVSDDGKLITNHHVAEPWIYTDSKTNDYTDLKSHIASILPDTLNQDQYKNYIEAHWNDYLLDEGDYSEEEIKNETMANIDSTSVNDEVNELISENKSEEEAISNTVTYLKPEDIEIIPHTIEIAIALHGSKDNWLECEVYKIANEKDVDVAILQLTSESLPESVANIIDLDEAIKDDTSLKPGTNAILIGYPMGLQLANTRKGIKVQVYEGQINKESDGVSIQYNVTSTHGASGSPVFNECGKLIAINYAGYEEAQGYNFGIVAKHALSLMK